MLGGNHLERYKSETSNYGRRPESPSYGTLLNQNSISHPNSQSQNGQSSRDIDSGSEFSRLSGELNQRLTREMSDFMSIVSFKIQRAINEAISDQILPQIQATLDLDKDTCLKQDGKIRLEDRNTDLKKP